MSIIGYSSNENQLDLVCELVSRLKPEIYLELGIKEARTIRSISKYAKRSIGVDINKPDEKIKNRYEFYKMTTDDFFKKVDDGYIDLPSIDVAFIDANHSKEYVLRDFYNVISRLNDQGVVILHDTYPDNENFVGGKMCGDAYKAAWEISNKDGFNLECFTLPIHPGITLIRKRNYQVPWARK